MKKKKLVIIIAMVMSFIPAMAFAEAFWIKLTEKPVSLEALPETFYGLSKTKQADAYVCLTDGQYQLVAKAPSAQKAVALQLNQRESGLGVIEVHEDQCFPPQQYLVGSKGKPRSPGRATSAPPETANTVAPTVKAAPGFPATTGSVKVDMTGAYNQRPSIDDEYGAFPLNNTDIEVLPETVTRISLSNTAINRFTCAGGRPVKDVLFSQEKGIQSKLEGPDAFIKFMVQLDPQTGTKVFATTESEFYITCGEEGTVYTVMGIPKNIPAQTIRLAGKTDKLKENKSLFEGKSFEKKVLNIAKEAYHGEYPPSYEATNVGTPLTAFSNTGVDGQLDRIVRVVGEGLRIKEYTLWLNNSLPHNRIKVQEKYFIIPELSESPVAIFMDTQYIQKKSETVKPTRLFVIEQVKGDF